jgi:hypothetical protein
MVKSVERTTVATPYYKRVQLEHLRKYNIFVKSYYGKRLLKSILGVKRQVEFI